MSPSCRVDRGRPPTAETAAGILVSPGRIQLAAMALILPATFGTVYCPWARLGGVLWLKIPGPPNPLVSLSEALRAVPTASVPHMALSASPRAMAALTMVLATVGIRGPSRRATS